MKNPLAVKLRDVSSTKQSAPPRRVLTVLAFRSSAPNLSARSRIVVHQPDACPIVRGPHRSRDARWASSYDQNFKGVMRIFTHRFLRPCLVRTRSGNFDNAG